MEPSSPPRIPEVRHRGTRASRSRDRRLTALRCLPNAATHPRYRTRGSLCAARKTQRRASDPETGGTCEPRTEHRRIDRRHPPPIRDLASSGTVSPLDDGKTSGGPYRSQTTASRALRQMTDTGAAPVDMGRRSANKIRRRNSDAAPTSPPAAGDRASPSAQPRSAKRHHQRDERVDLVGWPSLEHKMSTVASTIATNDSASRSSRPCFAPELDRASSAERLTSL